MITFDVLTIFPELFESFANESLLKRAQQKKLLKIEIHNIRDFTTDKHKKVDDKPFGGGLGMVFKIEPIFKAVQQIRNSQPRLEARRAKSEIRNKYKIQNTKYKILLFTPRGKRFTQQKAAELSRTKHLILICGRYEGIDERVAEHIADEELSMGGYVLMGGEIPAMAVIETIARLIPGVIGKPSFLKDRFLGASKGSVKGFLEYPQYTRPEIFRARLAKGGQATWKVPKVLLSGDHKKIGEWKAKHGMVICK